MENFDTHNLAHYLMTFDGINAELATIVNRGSEAPVAHRPLHTRAAITKLALNQGWLREHPEVSDFYRDLVGNLPDDQAAEEDSLSVLREYADQGLLGAEDVAELDLRELRLKVGPVAGAYLHLFTKIYTEPLPEEIAGPDPVEPTTPQPVVPEPIPEPPVEPLIQTIPIGPAVTILPVAPATEMVSASQASLITEIFPEQTVTESKRTPRKPMEPDLTPEVEKLRRRELAGVDEAEVRAGKHGKLVKMHEVNTAIALFETEPTKLDRAMLRYGTRGDRLEDLRQNDPKSPLYKDRMSENDYSTFKHKIYPPLRTDFESRLRQTGLAAGWLVASNRRGARYFLVHDLAVAAPAPFKQPMPAPKTQTVTPPKTIVRTYVIPSRASSPIEQSSQSKMLDEQRVIEFSTLLLSRTAELISVSNTSTMRLKDVARWMMNQMDGLTLGEAERALDDFIKSEDLFRKPHKGMAGITHKKPEDDGSKLARVEPVKAYEPEKGDIEALNDDNKAVAAAMMQYLCETVTHRQAGATPREIATAIRSFGLRATPEYVKLIARQLARREHAELFNKNIRGHTIQFIRPTTEEFKQAWKNPEKRKDIITGWSEKIAVKSDQE
jgi:hypothetical protein